METYAVIVRATIERHVEVTAPSRSAALRNATAIYLEPGCSRSDYSDGTLISATARLAKDTQP